jgi:membrane protein implicated in regulation of membrane protease activity
VPGWAIWLVIAAVLTAGEVITTGFILGPFAIAALLAAFASLLGLGLVAPVIVFIVASVAAVLFLRPIARRHLRTPAAIRTGTAALVGGRALVLERVDSLGGQVKIGGEVWSARAFFDDQVIEPGKQVEVAKIQGATALVFE